MCFPKLQGTIIAGSPEGSALACDETCAPQLVCCDLYGNTGGDWVGVIAEQYGQAGNISADPLFCDAAAGNLRLEEISPCLPENNPECGLIGAWGRGCAASAVGGPRAPDTALATEPAIVCDVFAPSPCAGVTMLRFRVPAGPAPRDVSLRLLDAAGRRVREFARGRTLPGEHTVFWDGQDGAGRAVAPGVYFGVLSWGTEAITRRVVVLR